MDRKKAWRHFALTHAVLLTGAVGFPVYFSIAKKLGNKLGGCLLHDWFRLYCPLCGGTRAVDALLHFRFAEAVRDNLAVVLLILFLALCDLIIFVRLLRGKEKLLHLPKYSWVILLVFFVLYGFVRNLVMFLYGIDPLGDLGGFWNPN